MSKVYDFLCECGSFMVLTMNGDSPAGRPFGAVMEVGEDLYLSTNDLNQAHKQLRANENIQIIALKPGTMQWVRITGTAHECGDAALKQKMLDECPVVKQVFDQTGVAHFLLFQVKVQNVEWK